MSTDAQRHLLGTLQVGTSRAAAGAIGLPAQLQQLSGASSGGASAEATLWRALAAHDLWQRAGLQAAGPAATAPQACPAETLRSCPRGAEATLALLLQDAFPQLRAEWFALLQAHGCHLPARYLPRVLDLGIQHAALRGAIGAVLGTRGHWLARHNPAWDWVGPDAAAGASLWEEGQLPQRVAALHAMRAHDSAAALVALQAVWASEPPEHRAALLACLATGLGPADEAFLEAALDDKRKEVRLAAQRLLAGVPGARLGARMLLRLQPLLHMEGDRLQVQLPQERDKAMQRDGVGVAAHPGLGEKAGWLADMLAAVPPSTWSEALGAAPARLLALAAATDYEHALLLGWASALQRCLPLQADARLHDWFATLTRHWLASERAGAFLPRDLSTLFGALPAPVAHAQLLLLVEAGKSAWTADQSNLIALLGDAARHTRAWPLELSLAVAARIRAGIASENAPGWALAHALAAFALVLDPRAAQGDWPGSGAGWTQLQDPLGVFLRTLQFRHDMTQPFQERSA